MSDRYRVFESTHLGEKYYFMKHRSGLEIFVFPKNMSSSYALFATRYGAIDNCFKREGDATFVTVPDGIAHFLEHKLFENEDGVDTFEKFGATGADANAYTSNAITAYLFSCTENFYDSLEILLDFVMRPYFTPETVKKEQGIISQEIKMYEDSPERLCYQKLLEIMYQKNPVRINVAGTVESIANITADLLYQCYHTFYNLSNMTLAVSGNIDPEQVADIADKLLPDTATPMNIVRSYEINDGDGVYQSRCRTAMQVSRPLFEIGVKDTVISSSPSERVRKQNAMNILNDILFSRSGKFYNALYEEGLIGPNLSYGFSHSKYFSFNSFSGQSDDPEEVFHRFCAYVEEMQRIGIDSDAFERCKRTAYAYAISAFDSTSSIASQLIDAAFDEYSVFEVPDLIRAITLEEVTALLHDVFRPECYAMSVVDPIENPYGPDNIHSQI